jgi:hypothetical protein
MPRSGTTVMFAAFATHPSVGWFSQYMHRFPRVTLFAALSRLSEILPVARAGVARHGETWSILNRLQISPAESTGEDYGIWTHCCGLKMQDSFLLGVEPTTEERDHLRAKVAATLRLGRKERFATKLTGPPRMGYLSGSFEDAIFIHVVRDPRAVVGSLMRVPFWRDTYRYTEPAWRGGIDEGELRAWREEGESPVALAALEWRTVLERARKESENVGNDRYLEVRYEDFIASPKEVLGRIFEFADLPPDQKPYEFVSERVGIRDLTENWRERLSQDEVRAIEVNAGGAIREFGYNSAVA